MVGVVEYKAIPFSSDSHRACLCLLMIATEHWNRGIGQAILSGVEAEPRSHPRMTVIVAGVQLNNSRALAFWQEHSYRAVSCPEVRPDLTTVLGLRKDSLSASRVGGDEVPNLLFRPAPGAIRWCGGFRFQSVPAANEGELYTHESA